VTNDTVEVAFMLRGVALVTGGAGFIGSHLAEALASLTEVEAVIVIDDLSNGSLENLKTCKRTGKLIFIHGDVRNEVLMRKVLNEYCVDYVFHHAARVSVSDSVRNPLMTESVNVGGTLVVLRAAMDFDIKRLVLASSCVIYGEAKNLPISEDEPPRPKSPYGVSKMTSEFYWMLAHELYGLKTVALRYFNVYGPRQKPGEYGGVISSFVSRAIRGLPPKIYGDGEQTRDFVHVSDVVQANLLAASRSVAIGEVFNIGSGREVTIKELADLVLRLTGLKKLKPEYGPPRPGDIRRSWANIEKAKRMLGFEPKTSLEKGIRELIRLWQASRLQSHG